jgi:translation initiation factor 2 subunit 2
MEQLYETNFLVDRLFNTLESKIGNKKKFSMKRPVVNDINKKTYIKNFEELCTMLNRDENHFKNYIEKELNIASSINENKALILDSRFKSAQIEDVINKYAKTYVVCKEPECKSGNTQMIKENRINYLVCNSCFARKAIEE